MSNPKFNNAPEWREFEKLVVRIEQTLVPLGAIVRSPDRLRSLLTNRLREVDASIRTKIGSTEILITVECRKRRATQDVTWLEQLASKKQALGVARTVAVSTSEFSIDATKAAEYYGIDLRVVRDIADQDIKGWKFPPLIVHLYKHSKLLTPPEVEFDMLPGETAASYSELPKVDINAAVFSRPSTVDNLTLNDLWNIAERQLELYSKKVPLDGQVVNFKLKLDVIGDLQVQTVAGPRIVRRINLHLALSKRKEVIPLSEAKLVEYADVGNLAIPGIGRAEFETKEASKNNLRIGMQVERDSDELAFTVQIIKPTENAG